MPKSLLIRSFSAFLICAVSAFSTISWAGSKALAETGVPDFAAVFDSLSLTAEGDRGMVVSAHPSATAAGKWILSRGGNAVDATLAALAALNVVEPQASGLGGGGYALYYSAATDSFYALDFRERVPEAVEIENYFQPDDSNRAVQRWGATSVLVPSCAAGWREFYTRFGTTPLTEIFAPAIQLADSGFPLTEYQRRKIEDKLQEISSDKTLSRIFLRDSLPAQAGDMIKQPGLAALYRRLADAGLDAFYDPPLSTDLIQTIQDGGGAMSQEDLDNYSVIYRPPLIGEYRGCEIITLGPPSGGGVGMLEALELLKGYDLPGMDHLGLESTHLIASAVRIARENVRRWIGDPDYFDVPVDSLLSPFRIAEKRRTIFPDSVDRKVKPMRKSRTGKSGDDHGNTTHLVVADEEGNLMCLTQSINYYFGSGLAVPAWDLILNNLMADFDHDTVGFNSIQANHRPASTMACTIIRKDGKPLAVIGTPGGTRIASTMTQVLVAMLDYGLSLEEAVDAPRFYTAGRRLVIETRFAPDVLEGLAEKGWKVDPTVDFDPYFGGVNAIEINPRSGAYTGCSDPRRDGAAAGL